MGNWNTTTQTISWFIKQHKLKALDLDPEYQRDLVWSPAYKIFLMDTVICNLSMPKIYLESITDEKGETLYKVADGKPEWLKLLLETGLNPNVFYLENNFVMLDDIKIWGSPISPSFGMGWAFNKDRGQEINEVWNTIPTDTDIVITHSPIYGYCDRASNTNQNVGCEDLYRRLHEVKPHLHFAGHIHEAYGWGTIPYKDEWGDIYTFNGCSCNLRYEVDNNPITFDYDFITRQLKFIHNEQK